MQKTRKRSKIKEHLADLRMDEKIVVGSGLLALVGCFLLPWGQGSYQPGMEFSYTGIQDRTWFIGWLVGIFAIISAVVALLPQYSAKFRKVGMERMMLPFVLGIESVLLVIVAFTVLSHNDRLGEDIGVGLFVVLLATAFITLGGLMGLRHENKLKRDRATTNPNEFLKFNEPERDHNAPGYGEEKPALTPEVSEKEDEDEEYDDTLGLYDDEEDEDDDGKQQPLSLD